MNSTFFGLEVAVKALATSQLGLDITGHNISNANTAGYTRQLTNIRQGIPLTLQGNGKQLTLGTGSTMDNVIRARDAYIDRQFRAETAKYEYWAGKQESLNTIEGLMNEPSDYSLHDDLDQFWNAWSELAKDPQNAGARAVVKERAMTLVDSFHHIDQQITNLEKDLDANVVVMIKQINTYADQIKQLNTQIKNAEVNLDNPNDLKDQRDALVDELSKLVPVRVVETKDESFSDRNVGIYKVIIGNDADGDNVLVNDQAVRYLEGTPPKINGFSRVVWKDNVQSAVKTGALLSAPVVIGVGDTIRLNIDGEVMDIDLTSIAGSYDGITPGFTLADLAAKLTTAINDASAQEPISVTYTGGRLEIASGSSGAASLIAFQEVSGSTGRVFTDAALSPAGTNTGSAAASVDGIYEGNGNTLTAVFHRAMPAALTASTALRGSADFTGGSISIAADGGEAVAVDLGSLINSAKPEKGAVYNLDNTEERTALLNDLQAQIDSTALNGKLTVSLDSNNKLVFTTANEGSSSSLGLSAITGSAANLGFTAGNAVGTNEGWTIRDNGIPQQTEMISGNGGGSITVAGLTVTTTAGAADGDTFTINLMRPDAMSKLGFDSKTASTWADLGVGGGKLAANMEIRDDYLEQFRNQVNALAQGIAKAVNVLHNTGQGLKLEGAGIDFFTSETGTAVTAANITVNSLILNDTDRIATGLKSSTLAVGDGSVALQIASLAQGWKPLSNQIGDNLFGTAGAAPVKAASFGDFYNAMIAQMGVDVQQSKRMSEGQSVLVIHMNNLRESSSGVSLDEEMTNLIKFQKSYSAAARIVTVLDSMFERIMAMGVTR